MTTLNKLFDQWQSPRALVQPPKHLKWKRAQRQIFNLCLAPQTKSNEGQPCISCTGVQHTLYLHPESILLHVRTLFWKAQVMEFIRILRGSVPLVFPSSMFSSCLTCLQVFVITSRSCIFIQRLCVFVVCGLCFMVFVPPSSPSCKFFCPDSFYCCNERVLLLPRGLLLCVHVGSNTSNIIDPVRPLNVWLSCSQKVKYDAISDEYLFF